MSYNQGIGKILSGGTNQGNTADVYFLPMNKNTIKFLKWVPGGDLLGIIGYRPLNTYELTFETAVFLTQLLQRVEPLEQVRGSSGSVPEAGLWQNAGRQARSEASYV